MSGDSKLDSYKPLPDFSKITDCSVSTDFWYVEQEKMKELSKKSKEERDSLKMSREKFTKEFNL